MSRLHYTARRGMVRELTEAIASGLPIDEKIQCGETPLHVATEAGQLACIQILIMAGADVNAETDGGETPLHRAASKGLMPAVQMLFDAGAEIDPKDEWGETPALRAAITNHREIVDYLLSHGADSSPSFDGLDVYGWSRIGGVLGRCSRDSNSPESDAFAVEVILRMMSEASSVEEYAARHGRGTIIFGYHQYQLPDVEAATWANRYAEILRDRDLLTQCEERFLDGEALEKARHLRYREVQRELRDARRKAQPNA